MTMYLYYRQWWARGVVACCVVLATFSLCPGAPSFDNELGVIGKYFAQLVSPDSLTTTQVGHTLRVTDGSALPDRFIDIGLVRLTSKSGPTALFSGRSTGWGCGYTVNGVYVWGAAPGGGQGVFTGPDWTKQFEEENTARIVLEVNEDGGDDDALAYNGNGTLKVWVLGGTSGIEYTVSLSASSTSGASPPGGVDFSGNTTTSVSVYGDGGATEVNMHGNTIGYATIDATCPNAPVAAPTAALAVVVGTSVRAVDFRDSSGDNNYDCRNADGSLLVPDSYEIKVAPPLNEPAVYKMGSNPRVSLKLESTPTVTKTVSGLISSDGDLKFGSNSTPVSIPFTSGDATISLDTTDSVANVIKVKNYAVNWRGFCDNLNLSCRIYTVYDAPKCNNQLYTKAILDVCVGDEWAKDCNKVDTSNDTTNIPRKVQSGAKTWHTRYGYATTGIKDNPFTWIPVHKGDCITYADLMTKGLLVLGVAAESKYIECWEHDDGDIQHWFFTSDKTPFWVSPDADADGDGVTNRNEPGYNENDPTSSTLEGVYVPAMDPVHDAAWRSTNAPWNYHGASSCAGHWWEVTFNSNPDHDTEANMTKWPNGHVISYPARRMGGGSQ